MINLIENTLRDGSYAIDFQFTKEHTEQIVSGLDGLGFKYIEVGHGLGLGSWNNPKYGLSAENDESYIRSAKQASKNARIVAFFIPGIGTEEDLKKAKDYGLDFVRVGTNINEFKKAKPYVALAKKLGLIVAVNLMKSYSVKSYEFSKIVKEIDSWGTADVIYLVDSAGCMMPTEIHEYIDKTKQKVSTSIGFHGHNNLSMAVANSVQAINSGATYVDTCVRGMGRSAGNAQTEIMIWMMSKMGLDTDIDLYKLYEFADNVVLPVMARKQGLSADEIHIGVSKFHTSFMPLVNNAIEKYGVEKKQLIKEVSDINCQLPTQDLFYEIANKINCDG